MLYDYRADMEFTPTGNMLPSLTTRYHFTFVHIVYALLLSVEVMQLNKQTNKTNKQSETSIVPTNRVQCPATLSERKTARGMSAKTVATSMQGMNDTTNELCTKRAESVTHAGLYNTGHRTKTHR